jgi:putative oxidoreductase
MKVVLTRLYQLQDSLKLISLDLLALLLRAYLFIIFWKSVQTKIVGGELFGQKLNVFNIGDSTFFLFEYEYALPLIPVNLATYLGTFSEFIFSLLLIFGLFTRFAALGLLGITLVIQFFVYPQAWAESHAFWAIAAAAILFLGAGRASIDQLIHRFVLKQTIR